MAKKRQTTGIPKAKKSTQSTQSAANQEQPSGGVVSDLRSLASGSLRDFESRAEREAYIQRLLILGVGAAVGLVAIILIIAFVSDQIIQPRQTVASVNGDGISVAEFQDRVRFERVVSSERLSAEINRIRLEQGLSLEEAGNIALSTQFYSTLWQELNTPDLMGLRVLNDMIDDQLIRQEAEERGITISQEEIDAEIQEVFNFNAALNGGFDSAETTPEAEGTAEITEEPSTPTPTPFVSPTPSPEPSPTVTPEIEPTATLTPFPTAPPPPTLTADEQTEQFDEILDDFYSTARREAGFNRDEVNAYFELQAIRAALSEVVAEPETTEVWVNSRHILVETEEEALDIIAALENGESFADLAVAASTDTGSGANGGELGWSPAAGFVDPFAEAVREAEIGAVVGPVQSEFGFHIIQVREREDRDLEDAQIEVNEAEAFEEWLSELRDSEENESQINNIWPDFVPSDPPWTYREL